MSAKIIPDTSTVNIYGENQTFFQYAYENNPLYSCLNSTQSKIFYLEKATLKNCTFDGVFTAGFQTHSLHFSILGVLTMEFICHVMQIRAVFEHGLYCVKESTDKTMSSHVFSTRICVATSAYVEWGPVAHLVTQYGLQINRSNDRACFRGCFIETFISLPRHSPTLI